MLTQETLNLNAVAGRFEVSRPAISKHIKILTECGLVEVKQQGRERYCQAKVEPLAAVSDWVQEVRQIWETRFDSLENYLQQLQAKGKSTD